MSRAARRGDFSRPNLDRDAKLAFYRGLTVLSVPALYGEAFGLYVVEAMASGVPVVAPNKASFPELIEQNQPAPCAQKAIRRPSPKRLGSCCSTVSA
ncbi:MAG: hypothetical protein CM1200mP29_00640 [Verrucomicrobiota bacterium]|nr:MAG: hypothetical protein CM1200mP29_00640 [Verrucomicrobiota bacterium]